MKFIGHVNTYSDYLNLIFTKLDAQTRDTARIDFNFDPTAITTGTELWLDTKTNTLIIKNGGQTK